MKIDNLLEICSVELDKKSNGITSIGINVTNKGIKVVFPRGYNLSQDNSSIRKDILLLIKVLDKYKSRKKGKIFDENKDDIGSGIGDKFPIKTALWLLSDYENNGLFNEYIHKYKVDKKGNIHWARTIKTQTPYINNNKNLVYTDFIIREKNNDLNNKIILIHKAIIENCINSLGWLYPHINIAKGNKLPFSKNVCMNILKKEFVVSNLDSKKQLIKNMMEFLEFSNDENDKFQLAEYKTDYFMNIWEEMLNVVFGNEDPKDYYPKAKWNIGGKESVEASNLRPDIILRDENIVYVLDAKYYKYGITGNVSDLPQSSDITKQMLYSSYIVTNYNIDEAYDAFLIPYDGSCKGVFNLIGNATVDIDEFREKKVDCILVDIKSVMKSYLQGINICKYREELKCLMK